MGRIDETAIAAVAHEANRMYCLALGDASQPCWMEAPEWQRKSEIDGVKFHIKNPSASPSAIHESWLEEKRRAGWRYGQEKDSEKKEHPCFVPFDNLPKEQQVKDVLFSSIVRALIPLL